MWRLLQIDKMMTECWCSDPRLRPSFNVLIHSVEEVRDSMDRWAATNFDLFRCQWRTVTAVFASTFTSVVQTEGWFPPPWWRWRAVYMSDPWPQEVNAPRGDLHYLWLGHRVKDFAFFSCHIGLFSLFNGLKVFFLRSFFIWLLFVFSFDVSKWAAAYFWKTKEEEVLVFDHHWNCCHWLKLSR